MAGEAFGFAYKDMFGLDFRVVRPSAPYGVAMGWPMFVKLMAEDSLRGRPVRFETGGPFPRSYTHIEDFATDQCGCLDVVINNAGINQRIPMLEVSAELLEHVWKIDYIRGYQLAQAAARAMIERGGGSIIHISSLNNQIGLEDVSMLGPTKAA